MCRRCRRCRHWPCRQWSFATAGQPLCECSVVACSEDASIRWKSNWLLSKQSSPRNARPLECLKDHPIVQSEDCEARRLWNYFRFAAATFLLQLHSVRATFCQSHIRIRPHWLKHPLASTCIHICWSIYTCRASTFCSIHIYWSIHTLPHSAASTFTTAALLTEKLYWSSGSFRWSQAGRYTADFCSVQLSYALSCVAFLYTFLCTPGT